MGDAQEPIQPSRRRGGRRGRRALSPTDAGTGGPSRVRPKQPPPKPTGQLCAYGICCHFGTCCVNAHTAEELQFFKERENLRLQLRQMSLQVEAKKIEYKKQKLEARQPLQPLNSLPQVQEKVKKVRSSSAAASSTSTASVSTKVAPIVSKSADVAPAPALVVASPATSHVSASTSFESTVSWPAISDMHRRCLESLKPCDNKCILKNGYENARFVGKFFVTEGHRLWGRVLPPSFFQAAPPTLDPATTLEPCQVFRADFAISYPGKHNLWLRHADTHFWYPVWKQDGTVLVARPPDQ